MTAARATEFTARPLVTEIMSVRVAELRMVRGLSPVGRALLDRRCQRLFRKALLAFEFGRGFSWDSQEIELSQAEAAVVQGNADDDVPAATGVRVFWTSQGAPTIEFLDAHGVPFAIAEFEPEGFSALIGECCDVLEVVSKGGLAAIVCKGAA